MADPSDDPYTMSLRLPGDLAEQLRGCASVQQESINETVRQAIQAHVDHLKQDAAFQARLKESMKRNADLLRRLARKGD